MEFFIQKLDKDEETGETINIDLADIINKIWENPNAFKKLKTKMKIYNNPKTKTVLTCNQSDANVISGFGKNKVIVTKTWKCKKFIGQFSKEHLSFVSHK